jgi:hypothetical protein
MIQRCVHDITKCSRLAQTATQSCVGGVHASSLFTQPPSHSRRTVHLTPALLHLPFLVHNFMHPHCSRMEQALLLSSRAIHKSSKAPVTPSLRPVYNLYTTDSFSNLKIVERAQDWSSKSWVIASPKLIAAKSFITSYPSHTELTIWLRLRYDRIWSEAVGKSYEHRTTDHQRSG